MTRTRPVLMILLATLWFATPAVGDEEGQPPRRSPYPDASQRSPAETRFAISMYGGYRSLAVTSELFAANEIDFGITDGDLRTGGYGFEFDFAVLSRVDVSVGFQTGEAATYASYLDLVYDDGGEIEHQTRLGLTELSLGLRFRLLDGSARFRPYLIAGATGTYYRYQEFGDFVDFETSDIYYDEYEEKSFLPGFFAGAGADFAVASVPGGARFELFGEFRYARTQGEHQDGFSGFGEFTLTRTGGLVGLRVRF